MTERHPKSALPTDRHGNLIVKEKPKPAPVAKKVAAKKKTTKKGKK